MKLTIDTMTITSTPRRLLSLALTLFISLINTACQSPQIVKGEARTVEAAKASLLNVDCCRVLSQISSLPSGGVGAEHDILLSASKERLRSPVGTGYYAAIQVPDALEQYHFEVQTFSSPTSNGRAIPIPIVLVLNDDFSLSRYSTVSMAAYRRAHPLGLWGERERLVIFVRVDRLRNPKERYIVITTPENTYGNSVSFSSEIGGGVSVVPLGSTIAVYSSSAEKIGATLISSPEGELRITNRSSLISKPFDRFVLF
jgi:hypothetical protein